MSILDEIPDILNEVMGDLVFYEAKLRREGATTGPAHNPTPGAPTFYECRALEDSWSATTRAGGLVAAADRKILILAASLRGVTPQEGDSVLVKGKTFLIASEGGSQPAVTTDPATALWQCRGRQ